MSAAARASCPMSPPEPCSPVFTPSSPNLLDSAGGFTRVQMEQLRDVMRNAVEDSVRAAVRSEFQALTRGQVHDDNGTCAAMGSKRSIVTEVFQGNGSDLTPNDSHDPVAQDFIRSHDAALSHDTVSHQCTSKRIVNQELRDAIRGPPKSTCEEGEQVRWIRHMARMIVHNNMRFDAVMGFLIVANSVTIGIETQLNINDAVPEYLAWVESFFLVCFILELVIRWAADGSENLRRKWFWFDFLLVLSGGISTWIIGPVKAMTNLEDVPVISQVLTLRVLRLMRLVRAFRLMEQFQDLWRLCCGFSKSLRTMLSVCLLVLVVVFVFACMGCETLNTSERLWDNDATREIVSARFGNLPMAILTLMQFANSDSISAIYVPICEEEPLFVFYFLALWLVVTVALMNLVTAIIVENAMANGKEDMEERQAQLRKTVKRILPEIEQVFDTLSVDGSKALTLDGIEAAALQGEMVLPDDIREFVEPGRLIDVFDFLDMDGSGDVTKTEFVDGVCSLVVSSVPIETTQILQLVRQTHHLVVDLQRAMDRMPHHRRPSQHSRNSTRDLTRDLSPRGLPDAASP